jgi:hypothetical protein
MTSCLVCRRRFSLTRFYNIFFARDMRISTVSTNLMSTQCTKYAVVTEDRIKTYFLLCETARIEL